VNHPSVDKQIKIVTLVIVIINCYSLKDFR